MYIGLVILYCTVIFTTVESYCQSTYLYAITDSSSHNVYHSLSYEYCTIEIQPSRHYNSHFLEISWLSSRFDVRGNMPRCNEAYLEVYLTRRYKSIGKFCSNNARVPFTMYSRDGYAKIVYNASDNARGGGFTFNYKLKPKASGYLGSPSSAYCYNTQSNAASGVIYSTGWPYGYRQSYAACNYEIQNPYDYGGFYVVFMDIDMDPYRFNDYCVSLYASDDIYYYAKISPRMCYRNYTATFTTYKKYLKIVFDRSTYGSSFRGFLAGYVGFGPVNQMRTTQQMVLSTNAAIQDSSQVSSVTVRIILGIVIPTTIILISIIVMYCKYGKRRSLNSTILQESQFHDIAAAAQQTRQMGSTMSYTNASFSALQRVHLTSNMRIGGHHTESCTALPSATSYPTSEINPSRDVPLQYSITATPFNYSFPAGSNGLYEQQPTSRVYTYNQHSMTAVNSACNDPPPPYSHIAC